MSKDNTTIPLHEMIADERVDALSGVFEKEGIQEDSKKRLLSYLIGVNEEEVKSNHIKMNEAGGNNTSDIGVIAKQMMPMITRGFGQTSAIEICGNFPMKQDQGKIAYMRNYYTNDQANSIAPAVSKVIVLADSAGFTAGTAITTNGTGTGIGVVRYVEDNTVFVEITSGSFAVGDSVDDDSPYSSAVTTVSAIYSAEIAHNVFAEYTKFASILAGENADEEIKEVEIGVELANVEAENHKLRLRYTNEFGARLRDYYGLDVEELTNSVGSLAFKQELNKRVFNIVLTNSTTGGTSTWNYASSDGRWEEEKIKTLMTMLNYKSSEILSANFMIAGNYIVVDPITYAYFASYGYLDTSSLPNGMADPMSNAFVGILNGMFRTYVNPWLRTRTISMGSKDFSGAPASETRAGVFFHPYLGLDITKTIRDASGQPVKFLWSMYGFTSHPFANTSGANDFFRRINVTNLPNS